MKKRELEGIGELLMAGFPGTKVNDSLKRLILDDRLGGVILFSRNIESPSQVKELNEQLQGLASQREGGSPLLLSLDQEGGRVFRLPPPFRQYPSYRTLCQEGSLENLRRTMVALAREIKNIGFNMNMAPVLDVDSNPANPIIGDRSFGPDPLEVSRWGAEVISAFTDEGIIAVGKHFPGHGDTDLDSHVDLPVLDKSLEELEALEFIPFSENITKGIPAIMTAHILFPKVDSLYPATLSQTILDGILRNKMGFEGVILSDDLEMKGVEEGFSLPQMVEKGVGAGLDIFLCCHTLEKQQTLLKELKGLYKKGGKARENILCSIERVKTLKKRIAP